jgi:hypothetical protein
MTSPFEDPFHQAKLAEDNTETASADADVSAPESSADAQLAHLLSPEEIHKDEISWMTATFNKRFGVWRYDEVNNSPTIIRFTTDQVSPEALQQYAIAMKNHNWQVVTDVENIQDNAPSWIEIYMPNHVRTADSSKSPETDNTDQLAA